MYILATGPKSVQLIYGSKAVPADIANDSSKQHMPGWPYHRES